MYVCQECSREYEYDRKKGHRKTLCNSCSVNLRRFKKKKELIALFGGECSMCGYNSNIKALQFHHLDPATKLFPISGGHCRSWENLLEEANKCVLVCANCHVELHDV